MDAGNSYLWQNPHIVTRNRKPCLACSLSKVKCNLISDQLCEHCARKGEVKCPPFVPNRMRKDVTSWMALVNPGTTNNLDSSMYSSEPTMQGNQSTPLQYPNMSYVQYAGVQGSGTGNWGSSMQPGFPIPSAPILNPSLPSPSSQGPQFYAVSTPQPQESGFGTVAPDPGPQFAAPMNVQLPRTY